MSYINALKKILSLDTPVYAELEEKNRLFAAAFLNVFLAGLFYGLASLYRTQVLLKDDLAGGFDNPLLGAAVYAVLVFAGIAAVFLAHAGFSLLLWAIGRGFGGKAPFFPVYLFTGAAMAPLWLGLPFAYLFANGFWSPLSLILGALGMAWAFVTITRSIMACQNFTFLRATITLALTIIFIVSFRILTSPL